MRFIVPIGTVLFLDYLAQSLVFPLFTPLFLSSSSNLFSPDVPLSERSFLLGLFFVMGTLGRIIGGPLMGLLSDRVGRKHALSLTVLSIGLSFVFLTLSITYGSLLGVFAFQFLKGLFSANEAICLASVADVAKTPLLRSTYFGYISAIGRAGFIGGNIFGAAMSDLSSALYLAALLFAVNLVLLLLFFDEPPQEKKLQKLTLKQNILATLHLKTLWLALFCYFFYKTGWVTMMSFLPSSLEVGFLLSAQMVSLILASLGIMEIFTNFFLNPLMVKRYSPPIVLNISLPLLILLFFGQFFLTSLPLYFLFTALIGIVSALAETNIRVLLSLSAPEQSQGKVMGLGVSASALAGIMSNSIGGVVSTFGVRFNSLFSMLTQFISLIFLWLRQKHHKNKEISL